jgi:hypothetical protein
MYANLMWVAVLNTNAGAVTCWPPACATPRIGICTQYKAQSLIRQVQRGWSFLDGRFEKFVEPLPTAARRGELV